MTASSTSTKYEVSGTRIPKGAIVAENFAEQIDAGSSRDAYIRIINKTGYTEVNVVAIKIECPTCSGFHLVIPVELYKR